MTLQVLLPCGDEINKFWLSKKEKEPDWFTVDQWCALCYQTETCKKKPVGGSRQ